MFRVDDIYTLRGDSFSRDFDFIASSRSYNKEFLETILKNTSVRGLRVKEDQINRIIEDEKKIIDVIFNSDDVYYILPGWNKLKRGE